MESVAKFFMEIINSQPPSGLLWLTVVVALSTFVLRFVVFVIDRLDKRKDRVLSVEDEYWFRTIIIPLCVEPLVSFVNESTNGIREISSPGIKGDYKEFLSDFQKSKESILSRFLVLRESDVYDSISSAMDSMDDSVTLFCARCSLTEEQFSQNAVTVSSVEKVMYSKLREVFDVLKVNHKNSNL